MPNKYKCFRCYLDFSKKYNIQMHLKRKIPCKKDINNHYSDVEIDILNKNQFEKNNITKNIDCDTFIKKQNITNINNTTTNNYIINIENLIPFNKDWDIEHISQNEQKMIIFSNIMYTLFLELILKNNNNSNVVIDKKNNKALIYQNNNYEELDLDELVDNSMEKINKQLKQVYDKIQKKFNDDYEPNILKNMHKIEHLFTDIQNDIDDKFKNYKNTNKIKKDVIKYIIDIYQENQNKALLYLKSNYEVNEINNGNGY